MMQKEAKYNLANTLYNILKATDNEQTKCLSIIGLCLLHEIDEYDPEKKPESYYIGKINPLNQNQFSHGEQVPENASLEHRIEEN